jgi:hypothetical protein
VGLVEVGEDKGQPADGGRVQRILELREIQEQLQNQLYDVFELMREQNLNEVEQRVVGGIWLNRLRDQLQPLTGVFIYLFESRNKTQGIIPKRYVPKATQTKETHHNLILRPPQMRCAKVIGGRRTPLQDKKRRRKKGAQVKND